MENWFDRSAVARREELRKIFMKYVEGAEGIVVRYIQKMKDSLDTILITKINKH